MLSADDVADAATESVDDVANVATDASMTVPIPMTPMAYVIFRRRVADAATRHRQPVTDIADAGVTNDVADVATDAWSTSATPSTDSVAASGTSLIGEHRSVFLASERVFNLIICATLRSDAEFQHWHRGFNFSRNDCFAYEPAATAITIPSPQLPYCTIIQLSKYKLKPFDGDIIKFQRFWSAFQLAIHNNPNIPPLDKYLQLQSLLTGDALMVPDDINLADNNYIVLPYMCSSNSFLKHKTRVPSFVALGLALRLYYTVFVDEIHAKLQELEYQSNSQFDLITKSCVKSTTLSYLRRDTFSLCHLTSVVRAIAAVTPLATSTIVVSLLLAETMNVERAASIALPSPTAILNITALLLTTITLQRLAWAQWTGAMRLAHRRRFAAYPHHLDVAILARGSHLHKSTSRAPERPQLGRSHGAEEHEGSSGREPLGKSASRNVWSTDSPRRSDLKAAPQEGGKEEAKERAE
ncbi:unnamed protein product [Heligmosomoides polygyrus]|uniref:Transmembrane protein n=1 Tax=Heligmosomoides polygyrus TaxID=6339 RepID=A0A3P8CJS3_HELPZ|nr:unnamed protein product [Heligmosomoides polygyrus]